MAKEAWYLGATPDQVGDRAILVGDPGRVQRVAARLNDVVVVNEDRSLLTVTGSYRGRTLTVSAFGMGAPIAAIVMHELASIGVTRFLRLGTAMALSPARIGEFLIADAAVRCESTSGTYVPPGYPAAADHDMCASLRRALLGAEQTWRAGLIASYDGFYTEMFAIEEHRRHQIEHEMASLQKLNVLGIDMETATLLAIGRSFGVQAGALCAVTVDWATSQRLPVEPRQHLEDLLVDAGLRALADEPEPASNDERAQPESAMATGQAAGTANRKDSTA